MSLVWKNKFVYFAYHFFISIAVFLAIVVVAKNTFFPDPWFSIDGALGTLKVAALIDLVAGPLLAAFIFDKRKKEWKRDVLIICLAQAAFLAYGMKSLWDIRPAHAVWMAGNIHTVSNNEAVAGGWKSGIVMYPEHHAIKLKSANELSEKMKEAEKIDIPFYALNNIWSNVWEKKQTGWDPQKLSFKSDNDDNTWSLFKKNNPGWEKYLYLGIYGRDGSALWVWDVENKQSKEILYVDIQK
jgi:hypothetical protein